MTNSFEALVRLSEQLVPLLSAEGFSVVQDGEYPATALRWGNSHLVLVRHFGYSFTISLPTKDSFPCRLIDDFSANIPTIIEAIKRYQAAHPKVVTMADVILSLRPVLPVVNGAWTADYPGTPAPSEAWLKNNDSAIGLFQSESSVRVVVWVGSDMRSFGLNSLDRLVPLSEWIGAQLEAQTKTDVRLADEEKKREAIQPPSLEKVLGALRNGTRLQLGGGRWYEVFFMKEGKLCREIFDEGYVDEEETTEQELQDSLARHAEQAQRQL
jgi:hypothetical protein